MMTKHLCIHFIFSLNVKRGSDNPPLTTKPYGSHKERENVDRSAQKLGATEIHPIVATCHMVSGTLALLYLVLGLKLSCSRAAAPIGNKIL